MNRSLYRTILFAVALMAGMVLVGSPSQPAYSTNVQVVSPANSGPGTLRQALLDASSGDTISFDPIVFPPGNPTTIFVQSALPTIIQNGLIIDASNAGVILNGSQAPAGTKGLRVESDNCTIRGMTIRSFPSDGIWLETGATGNTVGGDRTLGTGPYGRGNLIVLNGASGISIRGNQNYVRGNHIGIDPSGTWDWGNAYNGVAMWDGASENVVGGTIEGHRNVISGNDHNGIWIGGSGTQLNTVIGNYVGTRANGLGPVPNGLSGIAIHNGAPTNRIGGTLAGERNLISGNSDHGVYLSDAGTTGNQILGNYIGTDKNGTGIIGQGLNGVVVTQGAANTVIGSAGAPNLISGNAHDGILLEGSDTAGCRVQGNIIGANASGSAALPNGLHGIELTQGAHDNQIGGNRFLNRGNLISGNRNHGLVITDGAHHNTFSGNLVGPDASGTYSLGYHPWGGIDITNGAHDNMIGGPDNGEGNVISGNETDGIALFRIAGDGTSDNQVVGNLIGLTSDGNNPLPNGGFGILNAQGAARTHIEGNSIAFNESYGILVATCEGSTITQNAVYSNTLTGIRNEGYCPPPPQITGVEFGSTEIVTGTTEPNAWVEFFSEAEDEGQAFEGTVQADGAGSFVFGKVGGFAGPNLTATSTDAFGNTSEFSKPQHLWWTLLLYLNGDNDLEEFMIDTLTNSVAAGPSPRANVLVLVDGYTTTIPYSPTVVYDVTWGQAEPIDVTWNITGERNLGDGQTLVDFATWGRTYYPARYTLLAIVDHGGGWAGSTEPVPGVLPVRDHGWFSGISGLSWDFTSEYDYLDSQEIRQAMAAITDDGTQPIDVVFYDACLMGMTEVAYQIKDYASYFVSSQNIAWAPLGPQGRYIQTIQGIDPTGATPRQMAELLVQAYTSGLPPEGHPFTISAVDLAAMPLIADAVDQLATAIQQTPSPLLTETLQVVYGDTQKLDYDSDLRLEPDSEGFVDLYDLALRASEQFSDPDVLAAAETLRNELALAFVAEEHVSGSPWFSPTLTWDLDNVHGLSIFLPLGQDLDLDIPITRTSPITPGLIITRNLRLLEMYTCEQLEFVCDTSWRALIDTYYTGTTVPTDTAEFPEQRLLPPDITPPQTVIALTGVPTVGHNIYLTWVATDAQASVREASLWHRPPRGGWTSVGEAQPGASGVFTFTLSQICENGFAVRAIDRAGNLEPLNSGSNTVVITASPCHSLFMPTIRHRFLEFD